MTNLESFFHLKSYLNQEIIGQETLVSRMLVALLADGHILVEGAPGLAKTTAIKRLATSIEGDFHRVQFTPDLLPGDLTGTEIFRPQTGTFHFEPGPLFHDLLLADEINRAPAKVQSALLEAMAERQITVGQQTYELSPLFFVMATQNPLEQQGTYPLPEAQLDRFLLHIHIDYPTPEKEHEILALARREVIDQLEDKKQVPAVKINQETLFLARRECLETFLAPQLENYIVQLVQATRDPKYYSDELAAWVQFGASPRATIALERCARVLAWLEGKDFVTPGHIQSIASDVLRHRINLNYEAEAHGITTDDFIQGLINSVPVP